MEWHDSPLIPTGLGAKAADARMSFRLRPILSAQRRGILVDKTTIVKMLSSKEPYQNLFGHLGSQGRVHLQESRNISQILLPLTGTSGRIEDGPDVTREGRSGFALGGLNRARRRHR